MSEDILAKLEKLDDAIARREVLDMELERLKNEIITEEQRQEIADLELEFQPGIDTVKEQIKSLREEITTAVVMEGESVKGEHLHAIYNRGRVTFDNKGLQQLEKTNPEIWKVVKNFMKVGNPYASIRNVR